MNTMQFIAPIRDFVALGGPVIALLMGISVIALALIIVKLVQFASEKVGQHAAANKAVALWRQGQRAQAMNRIENGTGTVNATTRAAMSLASSGTMSKAAIEEEIARIALERLHNLQRGFRALDAIAQVSPLLGLFGTVLGMIAAFQQLQAAGNAVDPSALAGGIWVALLTTAAGLAVAMPVSLTLTFLESRVENERVAVETLTGAVLAQTTSVESRTQGDSGSVEAVHAAPA